MIPLENGCRAYFDGFKPMGQKSRGAQLGVILRIISCVTVVIPLFILGVYGIASLYNRCCHKEEQDLGDSRVANVAKQTLSSSDTSLPSSSIASSSIPPVNFFEEDSKMASANLQECAVKILEAELTHVASTFQVEYRYHQLMHCTPFSLIRTNSIPKSVVDTLFEKYTAEMIGEWNKLIDSRSYEENVLLFNEKAQEYREAYVKEIRADIQSSQLFMKTGMIREEELEGLAYRIFENFCSRVIEIESFQSCAPSQITKAIFIGPLHAAHALTLSGENLSKALVELWGKPAHSWTPERLQRLGGNPHRFKHVISILDRTKKNDAAAQLPVIPIYPRDMSGVHIDTADGPVIFEKLMVEKDRLMDLMDLAIASDEPLLIHCNEGMSRSVSTLIFYLIERCRWSPMKALSLIRQRRSIADPKAQIYSRLLQHAQQLGIDLDGEEQLIEPLSQMGPTTPLSHALMQLKIKQSSAIIFGSQAIEALNDEANRASSSTEGPSSNLDNNHQNSGQDFTNSQSSSSSISNSDPVGIAGR